MASIGQGLNVLRGREAAAIARTYSYLSRNIPVSAPKS